MQRGIILFLLTSLLPVFGRAQSVIPTSTPTPPILTLNLNENSITTICHNIDLKIERLAFPYDEISLSIILGPYRDDLKTAFFSSDPEVADLAIDTLAKLGTAGIEELKNRLLEHPTPFQLSEYRLSDNDLILRKISAFIKMLVQDNLQTVYNFHNFLDECLDKPVMNDPEFPLLILSSALKITNLCSINEIKKNSDDRIHKFCRYSVPVLFGKIETSLPIHDFGIEKKMDEIVLGHFEILKNMLLLLDPEFAPEIYFASDSNLRVVLEQFSSFRNVLILEKLAASIR